MSSLFSTFFDAFFSVEPRGGRRIGQGMADYFRAGWGFALDCVTRPGAAPVRLLTATAPAVGAQINRIAASHEGQRLLTPNRCVFFRMDLRAVPAWPTRGVGDRKLRRARGPGGTGVLPVGARTMIDLRPRNDSSPRTAGQASSGTRRLGRTTQIRPTTSK